MAVGGRLTGPMSQETDLYKPVSSTQWLRGHASLAEVSFQNGQHGQTQK